MIPADRRRLSRLLSTLADASVAEALRLIRPHGENCYRIGVTGAPGTGKSTLVARLALYRLRAGGGLAIIAIDPTSPISGGAILGDRIRMDMLATDPRVYIRSLASRTSVDGLADNLPDILAALDGFGFSDVIVETVGVGQVEYAIRALVDTLILVLTPGAGDQVQAMKSGILETADIYVINKADQPGAAQLAAELRSVLKQRGRIAQDWAPPILLTSTADATSLSRIAAEIDRHQAWVRDSGQWPAMHGVRQRQHVRSLIVRRVDELLREATPQAGQLPIDALYAAITGKLAGPGSADPPAG